MRATFRPARRELLVGGGILVAVVAIVVLTAALFQRGPTDRPTEKAELPPVVIVPGYGGMTTGLDVLAAALRNDGRFVRVMDLGAASLGDLHAQADLVKGAVDDMLRSTGSTSVDVVAFSAGGLAVRLWVSEDDGASSARRIITLSTPHHGTEKSAIPPVAGPTPCPVACEQLVAGSDVVRSLDQGDETPAGPEWVSIWSDDDEVVVPPTSARLDGALNFSVQSVCPHVTVSHQGMASNRVVVAMVRREIGRADPAVPDDTVCRTATATTPSGSASPRG
jgi:triacylglycerol esterase/lipase EstA (alpha/beta hydrolase family)